MSEPHQPFLWRWTRRVYVTLFGVAMGLAAVDPARSEPASTDTVIKRTSESAHVRAIPLAGHGGEENWSSLRLLPDGRVLVGMSSRAGSGTLLRVDPETGEIEPVMRLDQAGHLTGVQRQPKIHVTPVPVADGSYHFVSHFGLDTHLPLHGSRIGYEGMRWWRWHPQRGGDDLGLIHPGEGAVGLAATDGGETLYVSTFPQSLLFRLDTRTGEVSNLGRTNGVYAPRHIPIGPRQRPYVLDHRGRVWSLDDTGDHLVPTKTRLPRIDGVSGDVLAQGLVGLAPAQDGGYYAAAAWGRLYRIMWDERDGLRVDALAMPVQHLTGLSADRRASGPAATIAGLAEGPDGRLYLAVSGYNKAVDGSGDAFLLRCESDGTGTELLTRIDGEQIQYLAGCQGGDLKRGRVLFVGCHMTGDSPSLFLIPTDTPDNPARPGDDSS